jgi:hypothetical protein
MGSISPASRSSINDSWPCAVLKTEVRKKRPYGNGDRKQPRLKVRSSHVIRGVHDHTIAAYSVGGDHAVSRTRLCFGSHLCILSYHGQPGSYEWARSAPAAYCEKTSPLNQAVDASFSLAFRFSGGSSIDEDGIFFVFLIHSAALSSAGFSVVPHLRSAR